MSDQAPQDPTRQVRMSPRIRAQQSPKRTLWRKLQQFNAPRRQARWYWVHSLRKQDRNPVRGLLVTHRRQFGVSHKSVQPGDRNVID